MSNRIMLDLACGNNKRLGFIGIDLTRDGTHYPIVSDFKIEKIERSVTPAFSDQSAEAIAFAATHYWNVINEIAVTLRKPE